MNRLRFRWALSVVPFALLAACIPSRRPEVMYANQPPPPPYPPATYAPPPPAVTTAALPPPPVTAPLPHARRPPKIVIPAKRSPAPTPVPSAVGCGEIAVDDATIPFDCFSKGYVSVTASKTLARQTFAAPAADLPEFVDHRTEDAPAQNQRSVAASAAFALAAVVDEALIHGGTPGAAVSTLQIYARTTGDGFGDVVQTSVGRPIATEATLPWDEARACAVGKGTTTRLCKAKGDVATTEAGIAKAEQTPFARVDDVVELDSTNVDELRDTIARGSDIVLALRVDADSFRAVVHSADEEPLVPDYVGANAVTTLVIAGYAKQDGAWFFLLKNSWGPGWGKNGYAWVQEATLKKNAIGAWVVHASANGAKAAPPPVVASCPSGQAPDAVTKACSPVCPDQSPRTNGVCATTGANPCPPGFVNTTGACVVAAPDKSGSDPTSGVVWVCGAAGCTYTWPKGKLGCVNVSCSLSCPAPKFLAAVDATKKTIACTE